MLYRATRLACLGVLSFSMTVLHATTFPRGCEVSGFGYAGRYLVLNSEGSQTIFFMQNRTNQTIQLERHETRDVFMSPKLEVNLASNHWAAFASDEPGMNFQCSTKYGETSSAINCSDVLEICRYPRVRFALSNMGNYWVSTNKTLDSVVREAVAKGIYLKW